MRPTRSKAKVENHPSLMRDLRTTAIVNSDDAAFKRYMNDKRARLSTKEELDVLRAEIDYLKSLIFERNK